MTGQYLQIRIATQSLTSTVHLQEQSFLLFLAMHHHQLLECPSPVSEPPLNPFALTPEPHRLAIYTVARRRRIRRQAFSPARPALGWGRDRGVAAGQGAG